MRTKRMENIRSMYGAKKKGFSLIELVIIVSIIVVLAAILVPSLIQYTEKSRAQKDVTMMDEVVNAIQLAMSDAQCFDEMLLYACDNNFITYTDSSGKYGQQIVDNEYWAPDGWGRATTITFNPEKVNGQTAYVLANAYVNDMTYGNGSIAEQRVMQGQNIDENQCYLKDAALTGKDSGRLYNRLRQTVGDKIYNTSQTYANSSYTVFILFSQKDGVTVADVRGAFNGTNLDADAMASLGSGTDSYVDGDEDKPEGNKGGGKTQAQFSSSDLIGSGTFSSPMIEEIIKHNDKTVQEGAIYKEADKYLGFDWDNYEEIYEPGKEYQPGEELPSAPKDGDIYIYGDYEYRYNMFVYVQESETWVEEEWDDEGNWISGGYYTYEFNDYWESRSFDDEYYECYTDISGLYDKTEPGWTARVIDTTKSSYGPVLTEINGKPVNGMSFTYGNCTNLKDVSSIKLPITIDNVSYMFFECDNISSIPTTLKLPSFVLSARGLFYGCDKISQIPVTFKIPANVQDLGYMFAHTGITQIPATFQLAKGTKSVEKLFAYTKITETPAFMKWQNGLVDMNGLFYGCSQLTKINENFVIPEGVTNVSSMFAGTGLTTVPSYFKLPSSVTDTSRMFYDCPQLKTVEGDFNMTNVQTAYDMFYYCEQLKSVSGKLDITNVKNVGYMFGYCRNLTSLPNDFTLTHTQYANDMFSYCYKLESLPSNFSLGDSLQNASSMFDGCSSLTHLPDSFTIPNTLVQCDEMLEGCSKLQYLPDGFTFKNVPYQNQDFGSFFEGCKSLKRIPDTFRLPDQYDEDCYRMFSGCENLEYIPLDVFDNVKHIYYPSYMFYNCKKLKVAPRNMKLSYRSSYMFQNCTSLESIEGLILSSDNCRHMFDNCPNLSATIIVKYAYKYNTDTGSSYSWQSGYCTNAFKGTTKNIYLYASGSKYITAAELLAETSSRSNVIVMKDGIGTTIDTTQCESGVKITPSDTPLIPSSTITVSKSGKIIESFKVNGELISGNTYTVTASDQSKTLVFSDVKYYNLTIDNQISDFVYYSPNSNIKPSQTITISSYKSQGILSITINGEVLTFDGTTSYVQIQSPSTSGTIELSDIVYYELDVNNQCSDLVTIDKYNYVNGTVRLIPKDLHKKVTSFKLNGQVVNGDSFKAPSNGQVEITDVQLQDATILSTYTYTYTPEDIRNADSIYDYFNDYWENSSYYIIYLKMDLAEGDYVTDWNETWEGKTEKTIVRMPYYDEEIDYYYGSYELEIYLSNTISDDYEGLTITITHYE